MTTTGPLGPPPDVVARVDALLEEWEHERTVGHVLDALEGASVQPHGSWAEERWEWSGAMRWVPPRLRVGERERYGTVPTQRRPDPADTP